MKLTLILDAAPAGVRASLVEEWDEIRGSARMEPRVRLFDTEEQALVWGRSLGASPRAEAALPDRQQKSRRRVSRPRLGRIVALALALLLIDAAAATRRRGFERDAFAIS